MAKDEGYRDFVKLLALREENRTFLNSDEDHALDVLVQIFQKAQRIVRIFAGCLCKHVGNKPEYVIALSEFVERGGTLHILLNAFDEECAKESNLYKRLAYYVAQGKPVEIKLTKARPYRTGDQQKKEVHFTIGDENAYRIETDIEQRTAECNFNNPDLAKVTADFFDGLFNRDDAEILDVVKLFSDGD